MTKKESDYQRHLIKRIETEVLPGSMVLKNDSEYRPGIPDLSVLYKDRWGMLETKKSAKEKHQPNQDYYVDVAETMSFGAFIYPENEDEVLDDLQRSLQPGGRTRLPKPEQG